MYFEMINIDYNFDKILPSQRESHSAPVPKIIFLMNMIINFISVIIINNRIAKLHS